MIRWSSRMSIESATPAQAANPPNTFTERGGEEQLPLGMDWSWCA